MLVMCDSLVGQVLKFPGKWHLCPVLDYDDLANWKHDNVVQVVGKYFFNYDKCKDQEILAENDTKLVKKII